MTGGRTRRVVVGWSYENARRYCVLRGWSFRDTQIVSIQYYHSLRALRDAEVWLIGPDERYRPEDLEDIMSALKSQDMAYRYSETDWLL